jgi:DNA-binding SARP family transcriptional activator
MYQNLERALGEEFGIAPMPEVQQLYQKMR